jgi:hypothetical protein
MLWFAAGEFDDEGKKFRSQVRQSIPQAWKLGIERANKKTFASTFMTWSES